MAPIGVTVIRQVAERLLGAHTMNQLGSDSVPERIVDSADGAGGRAQVDPVLVHETS